MAGYDWAQGKSNNAVAAEGRGLSNATETAKACRDAGHKGVTAAFIGENPLVPGTGEWHHTSNMFNKTSYFDPEAVVEWLNTDEGVAELAQFKAEAKKAREARTTTGTVTWVEFEGSGRSNYGVEHRWSGEVMLKGKSIYFDDQRKLLSGNHIEFVEGDVDPDVVAANKTLADEKAAAEARRVEALQAAATAEAERQIPDRQAKREAKRRKYAKRDAEKRATKRLRAERAAAWRRLASRNETIQGTITWGSDQKVHSFTGEITLHDGEAMFNRSPGKTTRIRFFSRGWNLPTAEEMRRNITITEHPINNESQEAA